MKPEHGAGGASGTASNARVDYSKTVNLPRTEFPMRANLPQREPIIQRVWEERQVYRRIRAARAGRPKFVLHDGPPYANGNIHIGTALNKVLKDIVIRFATARGYDAPFVPGWDTHGLPIEHAALKELGVDRRQLTPLELRAKCAEYALKYRDLQREQFKRLGVLGDWDNPYMTLHKSYEAEQVRVFGAMARQGFIYRGLKSVYWCWSCETALAEAEIEYHERTSPSIYVGFPVTDGRGKLPEGTRVVVWTTTPWTIPANLAIAVHPDFAYGLYETPHGPLLLATELAAPAIAAMNEPPGGGGPAAPPAAAPAPPARAPAPLRTFRGRELEGVVTRHPLFERPSPLLLGELVTLEAGTGCVHIAPGHGPEDFELGRKHGLPVLSPVDERGRFTAEAGPFAGMFVEEGNAAIAAALRAAGALFGQDSVRHSYAHCWRCKSPILYRATEQWFASVDGFRRAALEAIKQVRWIPPWGEERIANMVAERGDWCISRQRAWGVPIPIFFCRRCGQHLVTDATIEAVADLFGREGSDAWWKYDARDILPPGTACAVCGHTEFRKETDIMDVWFDSGSSHAAVLAARPELTWPADLYLEGSDQHRGWFNSSLSTAVATRGRAPYRAVLTHGFVVDGEGRKMSKSLGNTVDPLQVMREYGADILRLWVASSDYKADIRVSPEILKQLAEIYRKIRNTARFLLGNLADFDPARDALPLERLQEIDRYALHLLAGLLRRVTEAYECYEYHLLYHAIHNFCVVDMSAFYLDVLKDRLYTEAARSPGRRAAQTALHHIALNLTKIIAPIMPHTADEIWQMLPRPAEEPDTVQLALWPEAPPAWRDEELAARWQRLRQVREQVSKAIEEARAAGVVKAPLEAAIALRASPALAEFLRGYQADLATVFIVSQVTVTDAAEPATGGLTVEVTRAGGMRCERCWIYYPRLSGSPQHPSICSRCAAALAAADSREAPGARPAAGERLAGPADA